MFSWQNKGEAEACKYFFRFLLACVSLAKVSGKAMPRVSVEGPTKEEGDREAAQLQSPTGFILLCPLPPTWDLKRPVSVSSSVKSGRICGEV